MAIQDEVRQGIGVLPHFFSLTPHNPGITEHLWGFARFAYLENPLPSLFKERLFVWLSRFCAVRYCIARHVGFLIGLGRPAGDAGSPVQSVDEVVALLSHAVPRGEALRPHIAFCEGLEQPLAGIPPPGSNAEWSLFACATHAFLDPDAEPGCLPALRHALGPARLDHLLTLLSFIHTAHYWTVTHPELTLEDDMRQLLASHQELSRLLLDDPEAGGGEVGRRLSTALDTLREENRQLAHEKEVLADSRLLHTISNELIGEQRIDTLYLKIIDAAMRLMDATSGTMQELDAAPGGHREFRLLGQRGLTPEAARFWERVRADTPSSCSAVLSRGTRAFIADVECDPTLAGTEDLAVFRQTGIRATQTTPLYSRRGELLGAISTHWRAPHLPGENKLQMLDILARQAADLIERTRAEEAMRASDARFRRALQPQNVGVMFFDIDGRITEANETFLKMGDYDRADLEAGRLRWDTLTPEEWLPDSLHAVEELTSRGYTTPYEKEYIRKDGGRWWSLFAATRLSETEGVEFVIDITDRKRAEGALQEADRRKDVFLATLAHELRNPLAPISNAVHLLRREHGRRTADRLMEMMDRQVRQIVRLVDDLLEVSRIAGGKIALNRAPATLREIVADAVETSRPLIEQGGHRLSVALPDEPVILHVDGVRLTQVLANLLNNAAKYTDRGGHIQVTAQVQADAVAILVRDDGIGIPPEQLPHVFDLFVQVPGSLGRSQGGLGVGLTMSRSLVEMHGGTIEAHSAGPGKGSEFVVRLPRPHEHGDGGGAPVAQAFRAPLTGKRILLVDDNRDAADSLGLLLQAEGAEVQVAYDGPAALALAAQFHPETVLLDLGMPGMDGYEVAQRLRSDAACEGMRVVALTGWGQDADRRHTHASGFNLHLTKPVDFDALRTWLAKGTGVAGNDPGGPARQRPSG